MPRSLLTGCDWGRWTASAGVVGVANPLTTFKTNGNNQVILTVTQQVMAGVLIIIIAAGVLSAFGAFLATRDIPHIKEVLDRQVRRTEALEHRFITKDVFNEHVRNDKIKP